MGGKVITRQKVSPQNTSLLVSVPCPENQGDANFTVFAVNRADGRTYAGIPSIPKTTTLCEPCKSTYYACI